MTTMTWLAGFAVFLLFLFHFSLLVSFRARFHGWLALGWLGNCIYLYAEYQADKGRVDPEVPYLISSLLLVFFVLADRDINWYPRSVAAAVLGVGLLLIIFPGIIAYEYSGSFLVYTIGGAIFSALVYLRLGFSFVRLKMQDLRQLFLKDSERVLYGEADTDGSGASRFLPVDSGVQDLERKAALIAGWGKLVLTSSFMGFGILQLAYPLREAIVAVGRPFWVSFFVMGMMLKLSTGAGFVVLLASHTRWVEILRRKAALSQELTRITASVEHDMRGPIGELNIIIVHLEEKAREGNARYSSFLLEQAKYLSFVQAKIRAVMEMILAMRESPEEFERKKQTFSIGDPLRQALSSVKVLHEQANPVIRTEGFNPGLKIAGNSRRLAQAFRNIINNAVEASLEKNGHGRPTVYVTTSVERERERVHVMFRDEGVGIDPEIQHRITEAGVSTKKDSPTPNRGLGLYIAKHLVALHGGELSFASVPSQGTTVTVVLPLVTGK